MPPVRVTSDELVLLRSKQQRYRVYFAPFGVFQLYAKTNKKDATRSKTINRGKWKPVINVGPHRIAFVGEPVTFDAQDSMVVEFDTYGNRHHGGGHDQGHGKGNLRKARSNSSFTNSVRYEYKLPNIYYANAINDDTRSYDNSPGDKMQLRWKLYKVDPEHTELNRGVPLPNDLRPNPEWQPRDTVLADWDTPVSWTLREPGLWRVEVGDNLNRDPDDLTANPVATYAPLAVRWVRVYPDRESLGWSVTAVGGLQGGWGGGWKCSVQLQSSSLEPAPVPFEKFQCFGLYVEDEWWDGERWVVRPIGSCRQEPRCLFVGYASEGGIEVSADTKSVTLNLETVDGQMGRSMMHKTAIWQGKGNIPDQPSKSQKKSYNKSRKAEQKAKRQQHKANQQAIASGGTPTTYTDSGANGSSDNNDNTNKNQYDPNAVDKYGNATDEWGAVLHGFKWVCVTDFALYTLQFNTNLLRWHDFYGLWNEQLGDLETIAGDETSIASVLQTAADNDWLVTGADHSNALIFGPDRQVTTDPAGWDRAWPVAMAFEEPDLWTANGGQALEKRVKYVRLQARRTASQRLLVCNYPTKLPSTAQPGTWVVKTNLLHDNKQVLQRRTKKVFLHENLVWTATLTTGLNRLVRAGDYVVVRVPFWHRDGDERSYGLDKVFLVNSVSYQLDPGAGSWQTSFEIEESISQLSNEDVSAMVIGALGYDPATLP